MTACRCCGCEMDAKEQQAIVPGRPGILLLTCWQEECALNGFTFSARTYAELDLTPYLAKSVTR